MNDKEKIFQEYLEKRKEYQKLSQGVQEVDLLIKICDLAREIYGEESNKHIYYLNELGGASKYIGEYELGLKSLRRAQKLIENIYGKTSIPYATNLLNIIEVLRYRGETDSLEPMYLEVLDIYEKNNYTKAYEYAGLCNNVGLFYQNMGNISKAIPYHEKSLEILKDMENHIVEYATTLNNLVMPYNESGNKEKAMKYLDRALEIYANKLGKHHSMYGAALNNKAIIKFQDGDYIASLNIFEEALEIVKKSFGENSANYSNLLSNVEYIRELVKNSDKKIEIEVDENSSLLDKSKEYTKKYILPEIEKKNPELLDKISIGLIGEGSEVLGYDDEYSRDHDYTFMPAIFLDEDDYIKYRNTLEDILLSLPKEFLGITHNSNEVIKERREIQNLDEYLYRYIGKNNTDLSIMDYRVIKETALLALTSGEIFYSGNKRLENIRNDLKYYPDIIRENKIATVCSKIAQSGQYNYLRLMKRGDIIGANAALNIFIENTIHLVYLLNRKYMPFYKWYSKGLQELEILGKEIYKRIKDILENKELDKFQISNRIEEICYFLVEEIKKQKLSNIKGYFMLNHAIFIQRNIDDDFLKNWTNFED